MVVKKRLGEMLIEAGVIDQTQLHSALGHQRKWGGKLGQALLDLRLATEPQIVSALARKFGYEALNVSTMERTPALDYALRLVPGELALRQTLLPIAADSSSLTVAMGDPSNIAVIDELSFRTGRRIKIALAGDREIAAAVRRLYFGDAGPGRVAPIPLEDPSSETPLETTHDPFAAMPDQVREDYFQRPARTLSPAEAVPTRGRGDAGEQGATGRPGAAAPPPLPAGHQATRESPSLTPPPVLSRAQVGQGPDPIHMSATADHAPFAIGAGSEDLLGEPVLATDLAPVEAGPAEDSQREQALTPREAALLDALQRAARGEESVLIRPAHLAAVLARLLLKRGILAEAELLRELAKR